MQGVRNLARLTPEQLVAEIRRAQADIEETARYMGQAALLLHAQTRRPSFREAVSKTAAIPENTPREVADRLRQDVVTEATSVFMLYANTWQRYSGMVLQGVRRTSTTERIMQRLQEKQGLAGEEPVPEVAPPPPPESPQPERAPMEDLVELYGAETVNYAQR